MSALIDTFYSMQVNVSYEKAEYRYLQRTSSKLLDVSCTTLPTANTGRNIYINRLYAS